MLDLHCHILPGVDDGAQTVDDSIKMAKKAVKQGITHILCTPHHNRRYQNPKAEIIPAVEELQTILEEQGIPLTLFEGQEVRIHDQLVQEIEEDRILFVDVTDRYLLIEFPTAEIPYYAESVLYELCQLGHVPIIVHPERNLGFQAEPNQLLSFLNMGCLAQLTAPSIVGIFGKSVQKLSHQLVESGLVQMVASDAHRLKQRDFYLKEASEYIIKHFGEKHWEQMDQMSRDVVNGDPVDPFNYRELI
ncbi:tyrosine-protein phosphatase [Enterococcus sp. AZ109]|uniref:tyrosine-protein phosphatase n=1 Tax=Enterococcus sp. AZ109 TaxID=2774634 RepID=UPI003F270CA5